jgi:hypothetical protein
MNNFYFVICSSEIVVATFFINLIYLSHLIYLSDSFLKSYKGYRFFEQNFYHFVK